MAKNKIDKRIMKDFSASALITMMIGRALLGAPDIKTNSNDGKDMFDISEFYHKTTQSIEDFLEETFSRETTRKNYGVSRIEDIIRPTETYSKNEIKTMVDRDVYQRVTVKKINGKYSSIYEDRLSDVFPYIYAVYNGLKPKDPITLELLVALSRGESAFNPNAKSGTSVRGLFQTTHRTFVRFLPEYAHLFYGPKKDIDKLIELEKDPLLSSYVAVKYLEYLDEFFTQNDRLYNRSIKKEKQRKLIAAYNAGEGNMQDAGFEINRLPNTPYPYRTDAKGLSDIVLYWVHGNDEYVSNYEETPQKHESNSRKYNSKKPHASKR